MDQIPPNKFKYVLEGQFVTWPLAGGKWHVFGWEEVLRVGSVVKVERFSGSPSDTYVEILEHVAERMVKRRDGQELRFVMCTFDKTVEEED